MITDVGGITTADGAQIRTDTVFRLSGGLAGPDELAALKRAGLRCVVDMRGPTEPREAIRDWAGAAGIEYVAQPIPAADRSDFVDLVESRGSAAEAAAVMERIYRGIVDHHGPQIAGTIDAVARNLPAGFGCAAGKDRTGIVTAFLHTTLGVALEDVVHHYTVSAPPLARLAVLAQDYFGLVEGEAMPPAVEIFMSARPETMRDTLAHVEATHGGVEQYLVDHGLRAEAIDELRARLVVARAA
ncbi:MAG TPA: tyrosine-protein phosphatase [Solirubrobacteraceae bacterium]